MGLSEKDRQEQFREWDRQEQRRQAERDKGPLHRERQSLRDAIRESPEEDEKISRERWRKRIAEIDVAIERGAK